MIPLSRSAFWGPMAITIMGGLFVATFLTLLFLPSLYALWYRKRLDERGDEAGELSPALQGMQQSGGIPVAVAAE
jgi:multidrug efflux pump